LRAPLAGAAVRVPDGGIGPFVGRSREPFPARPQTPGAPCKAGVGPVTLGVTLPLWRAQAGPGP